MTQWLNLGEVSFLHAAGLQAFGGTEGLRDRGLLESAIAEPFATFAQQELYSSLWDKVAALGRSLICNHPFVDGNKRVGFAAMSVVLKRNGYDLVCTADEGETMVLNVATSAINRHDLAAWLEQHSIKIAP
jgi:death-on-curing protein